MRFIATLLALSFFMSAPIAAPAAQRRPPAGRSGGFDFNRDVRSAPQQRPQPPQQRPQPPQQRTTNNTNVNRNTNVNVDKTRTTNVNVNRSNTVVVNNPVYRGPAWGWNGGVVWTPAYGYYGGGFWGAMAIGVTTAAVYGTIVDSASHTTYTSYQVQPNSAGATLLANYQLTQTPCGPPNLVVIYGPSDSVICAYPNTLVAAGTYTLDASTLTLSSS